MKILEVRSLYFTEVKIIRFARFRDQRGFFSEVYRKNDFDLHPKLGFIKDVSFIQANVSYSKKKTIRGLHFQWNPYMSKLIRVILGKMIDLILDIRKGSPHFGKIIAYDLSTDIDKEYNQWIWVPKGFAHGSVYLENTFIEYLCDEVWNPESEASISPLAPDIDWSSCEGKFKTLFNRILSQKPLISEKDRTGFTIEDWANSPDSENFIYTA